MNPHPFTMQYLGLAALRPGMYMHDFDLRQLEMQLYGFDAGLDAAGVLANYDRFNRTFSDWLASSRGMSCSQGWAQSILNAHGQSETAFGKFLALLAEATNGTSRPSLK